MNASLASHPAAKGPAKEPRTPAQAEPVVPPIHSSPSGGMTGSPAGASTGMSGGISHRSLEKQDGSVKISGGVG